MALPEFLSKIVDWLRAGYPEGVPEHDYIPLFALLGSQLTNDEVSSIADELTTSADPESADAIKNAISTVTHPDFLAVSGGRAAHRRPVPRGVSAVSAGADVSAHRLCLRDDRAVLH